MRSSDFGKASQLRLPSVRRAVVQVNLDPGGVLREAADVQRALSSLAATGAPVLASDVERMPATAREIGLLLDGDDVTELCTEGERRCAEALAAAGLTASPVATAVAFVSSGTMEDALGIVRAFGATLSSRDLEFIDDHLAIVTLPAAALDEICTERLQTALEASLNREILFRQPST
jgi:hypothetical protein